MHFSVVLTVFFAFTTGVFARPGPALSDSKKTDCRDSSLIQCVSPVISFIFSSEGQQLSKIRKSSLLTEPAHNKVCRLVQSTHSCLNSWVTRCVPENRTDVHILSNGTGQWLAECSEPGAHAKLKKMLNCAEKMNNTHKTCGATLKGSLPTSTGKVNYQNPKEILHREHMQRDVCCLLKKYSDCMNPAMATVCEEEEKTLTEKFLNRVFGAYKCTEATFTSCPTTAA